MLKLIIFFSVSFIFSISRNCKGIKILLAICPSSHRSKDFLPQQDVFWNLRLRSVSEFVFAVLVSRRLGLSVPLHWVLFMFSFHCGSFRWVGLLLRLASTLRGQAEVISARLNPRSGTIDVGGVCNFPGLSRCSKNLKQWMDQCYSSVLFGKQRKMHPWSVRVGRLKRLEEKPEAQFLLLFLCVFSPPPEPALCKLS